MILCSKNQKYQSALTLLLKMAQLTLQVLGNSLHSVDFNKTMKLI